MRTRPVLFAVFSAMSLAFAQQYGLLIKNGHVIDGKNRISAVRDVAIRDHRIAAVARNIPAAQAKQTVDARGLYVTAGLVDIHAHVYANTGERSSYAGDLCVAPDGFTFRSGVTTVADAGGCGWRTFPDFKDRIVDRAKTRVLAFLNIVGNGMRGGQYEQNVEDMDPRATAGQAMRNKGTVVGIKTAHFTGPQWTAVERAVEAGELAGMPVMADFGAFRPERPFEELVAGKLRPGDISTHLYLGMAPILDEAGHVRPYLFEARKRGVLFDAGHGGGSFLFRLAAPAMAQGFAPDSISTDLHVGSMNAGMKDMLNVMSKFLNLGMPLDEVILRSTWVPAHMIHRDELGHLTVGAPADVAVLRVEKGRFGFVDSYGARLDGKRKLVCELTVRNGLVVWDLNGLTRPDWKTLGKDYTAQGGDAWDGTLNPAVRARKK